MEGSLTKQKGVALRQHSSREKCPRLPSLEQRALVRLVTGPLGGSDCVFSKAR